MEIPPSELVAGTAEGPPAKKKRPAKPRVKKPKAGAEGDGTAGGAGGAGAPRGRGRGAGGAKGSGGTRGKGTGAGRGKGGRGKKQMDDSKEALLAQLVKVEGGQNPEIEFEEPMGPSHRDLFTKDLPNLMYGHGDDREPIKESVELLEDMAVEYVTDIVHKAMALVNKRTAAAGGAGSKAKAEQLSLDDLLAVLRRDPRKYSRVREIVAMQDTIKAARKAVKTDEDLMDAAADLGAEGDDMPV